VPTVVRITGPRFRISIANRQASDFDSITLRAESGDTTATVLQDVYPTVRRKAARLHFPHCQAFPFFLGGLSGAPSEVGMHSRNAGGVTLWTHNTYNNEIGKRQLGPCPPCPQKRTFEHVCFVP
jgi:hypothetical protein